MVGGRKLAMRKSGREYTTLNYACNYEASTELIMVSDRINQASSNEKTK